MFKEIGICAYNSRGYSTELFYYFTNIAWFAPTANA